MDGRRGDFSFSEGIVLGDRDCEDRYAVFAKQGSVYGRPGRSKVKTSSGTTTLRAASGWIPRVPRKVEAARLEP